MDHEAFTAILGNIGVFSTYDKSIMGSGDLLKLETWIDASHVVHEDMRGHTVGCMSCGVVIIQYNVSKQKLNIKSTME